MNSLYGAVDEYSAQVVDELIIKRVLALPGERVVIENGTLTVYEKGSNTPLQPDIDAAWSSTYIADDSEERLEMTLAENELFVSGDNRPYSVDSRFNGPITTRQIVGIVFL